MDVSASALQQSITLRQAKKLVQCMAHEQSFLLLSPPGVGKSEMVFQAAAEAGEDAKVLGGGQSLIPVLRLRLAAPTMVVDLARISELRGVRDDGDAIVIGAMTTHHDVLADPLVAEHAALLAAASDPPRSSTALPAFRHRAAASAVTFGRAS